MHTRFGLVLMMTHSCNLRCRYCYTVPSQIDRSETRLLAQPSDVPSVPSLPAARWNSGSSAANRCWKPSE